ncbi:SlyX family protein [Dyella humi]|uniref:SlyX family protein n=1 Tax=Dyella humi TaxID=1770547 RepID=A0ABW8IFL4_9GAMM
MSSAEERLTELEVRLAFIDDAVQALVAADAEQSLRIATLERLVRDMRNELETVRLGQDPDSHSEPPPPHY